MSWALTSIVPRPTQLGRGRWAAQARPCRHQLQSGIHRHLLKTSWRRKAGCGDLLPSRMITKHQSGERTALWGVFVSTHILSMDSGNEANTGFLPWKANKGPGCLPLPREKYFSDNKNFLFPTCRQTLAFLGCGLHRLGWYGSSWDGPSPTSASLCTDKPLDLQSPWTAAQRGVYCALQSCKRSRFELDHSSHSFWRTQLHIANKRAELSTDTSRQGAAPRTRRTVPTSCLAQGAPAAVWCLASKRVSLNPGRKLLRCDGPKHFLNFYRRH